MRIKITTNGEVTHGSKITDLDTGQQVLWVTRVELVMDATEGIRATLYIHDQVQDKILPFDVDEVTFELVDQP